MHEDDESDPLIGRVIDGRFTIQSVLGRGGMGVVYRAYQASLERSVALKVMTGVPPEREAEFQRRFFLEAATAAKLKHPNTITVFDYGSSLVDDERIFFIAMELLEGMPLQKLVGKGRALAPLRAVHIALQISRSLREAHKMGVVHRDLKPGNVMLVKQDDADDLEGDFVKVLDFGLAKVPTGEKTGGPVEGLTKAGTFMGSPRYVAPEQVEGRPVDARADIYSLGCILYRMLTGRVPFDGKSPVEIMLKHLHEPVPRLGVPGLPLSLERLVADSLHKNAGDRPQSMDAVLQRLKLVRAELGGTGSGIIVMSDERTSIPPQPVEVSEPPVPVVDPAPVELVAKKPAPRSFEDSTRPTRVLGKLTVQRQPKKPWPAIAAGVVVGLLLCGGGVAWRLGLVDVWLAAARPALVRAGLVAPPPEAPSAPDVPAGPFAKLAMIRIVTEPAGADVLEVQDGLPRLLGVTPLTIRWDIGPKPRELLLRKDGYKPSAATIAPPAKGPSEPVWLDVEAQLHAR